MKWFAPYIVDAAPQPIGATLTNVRFWSGISPRTAEIYRANAMAKTQAKSLSELVRPALLAGHAGGDAP